MIVHVTHRNRLVRAILPAIAVWALFGLCTGCFGQAEEEKWAREITGANIGRDVHAFKTAAKMYEIAPTKPYDRRAADLIDTVTRKLKSRQSPESRDVSRDLLELNPYRKSAEVQAVVPTWADINARYLRNSTGGSSEAAKKWFDQANLDYNAKSFWRRGLARTYGGAETSRARLISAAVFIILTAIMMFVCTKLGAAGSSGCAAFGAFVFVGGFCYILFWGLPAGMWWVLMAAYALVLGGVCANAAEGT